MKFRLPLVTLTRLTLVQVILGMGLACVAALATAQEASANVNPNTNQGDAKQGKVLAYTCHGCHGIEDYKNVYPTYSVPKLGGQHSQYLTDALKEYDSGDRAHATMHAHAASLSEKDRADIAAFFQGPAPRASAAPVGTPPASTALCVTCHGNDGISISPMYPILAGQHRDYIERALHDYKSGKRKNAIMSGIVAQVKDEDISAIASFFASQKSPLCATDLIRKHGKCD
jgi:cytochrome c553